MDDKYDISLIYRIIDSLKDSCDTDSTLPSEEDVRTIASAGERVSPRFISSLEKDTDVFVFGSNEEGVHDDRASKLASEQFGAVQGIGEGLQGQSYALPTTCCDKENPKKRVYYTLDQIRDHVEKFIQVAKDEPGRDFYVTRVGCGRSAHSDWEIAPLFRDALKLRNVYLPQSFLDVLFDVKPEVHNPSLMVPSTSRGPQSFISALDHQFSQYLMLIRSRYWRPSDGKKYDDLYLDTVDSAERMINAIMRAVDLSMRGLPSLGYASLVETLDALQAGEKAILPFVDIDNEHQLYRMRVEPDNMKKKLVDANGMFHIPFSMRGGVKTQRYSVPGYPCLYMGEHIFGCWEEMGRPNLNSCLISRIDNVKPFKVLDLRVPDESEWDCTDGTLPVKTIVMFPLIIACTFIQSDHKADFKPEYIIPQFLLQYVKNFGFKKNLTRRKDDYDIYGIRYTSVHFRQSRKSDAAHFCTAPNAFENYVIPVISITNEHCHHLASAFHVSDPICEEFERVKDNANGWDGTVTGGSVFDQLETILTGLDDKELKMVD